MLSKTKNKQMKREKLKSRTPYRMLSSRTVHSMHDQALYALPCAVEKHKFPVRGLQFKQITPMESLLDGKV